MAAIFPKGIASFTTKRNLLDDVDAEDVNRLQDEIVAIETVLGAMITRPADTNQDEFANIADRLNFLNDGKNIVCAAATAADVGLPNRAKTNDGDIPRLIPLDQPTVSQDPFGLYDGTGFTLPSAGFWILQGHLNVALQNTGTDATARQNYGVYQAAIALNDQNWRRGADRLWNNVDTDWDNVFLSPLWMGWIPANTRITLRCSQSSALNQRITQASLSVYRVRGMA